MKKTKPFKYVITASFLALNMFVGLPALADKKSDSEQSRLDAACEVARQEKLAPLRDGYIEECVEKEQRPDRAACEKFYADYGNKSGRRASLFYGLPECEQAFEYRQDH